MGMDDGTGTGTSCGTGCGTGCGVRGETGGETGGDTGRDTTGRGSGEGVGDEQRTVPQIPAATAAAIFSSAATKTIQHRCRCCASTVAAATLPVGGVAAAAAVASEADKRSSRTWSLNVTLPCCPLSSSSVPRNMSSRSSSVELLPVSCWCWCCTCCGRDMLVAVGGGTKHEIRKQKAWRW
jgi:hypothetical protein